MDSNLCLSSFFFLSFSFLLKGLIEPCRKNSNQTAPLASHQSIQPPQRLGTGCRHRSKALPRAATHSSVCWALHNLSRSNISTANSKGTVFWDCSSSYHVPRHGSQGQHEKMTQAIQLAQKLTIHTCVSITICLIMHTLCADNKV